MISDCLFLDLLTMYASKANWRLLSGVTDRSSLIFAAPKYQHKLLNTILLNSMILNKGSYTVIKGAQSKCYIKKWKLLYYNVT